MKKQIIFGTFLAINILCSQYCHADDITCAETEWKTCSYANMNIEICDKDGWQDYRCKAGYYYQTGSKPNSCTSSCHPCPSDGTSDPNNNVNITSCYQKPGTHSDTTGTYKLTANCYYKE